MSWCCCGVLPSFSSFLRASDMVWFRVLVQEPTGDGFPKTAPSAPLRGPAHNHRLWSFGCRMKLCFISARPNPCGAWAPPSMAPHSFVRLHPACLSGLRAGFTDLLGQGYPGSFVFGLP